MRRIHPLAAIAAALLGLAACTTSGAAVAVTGLQIARGIYCTAITEEGRQAIRDAYTSGVQYLECPPGTAHLPTPAEMSELADPVSR